MMEKRNFRITADTPEEYAEIRSKLEKLPDYITDQIEVAESSLSGIKVIIKNDFKDPQELYVPVPSHIAHFEKSVMVFCHDVIFELTGELLKKRINYRFWNPEHENQYTKNNPEQQPLVFVKIKGYKV
jgi:hypothetical protein